MTWLDFGNIRFAKSKMAAILVISGFGDFGNLKEKSIDFHKTWNIGVIWSFYDVFTLWENLLCKIQDGRHLRPPCTLTINVLISQKILGIDFWNLKNDHYGRTVSQKCYKIFLRLISLISLIGDREKFVSTLSQEPIDGLPPNFKFRCNMRISWTD